MCTFAIEHIETTHMNEPLCSNSDNLIILQMLLQKQQQKTHNTHDTK